ncbi:hypothetical protein N7537_004716 [Penicillium hordei]|uniref:Uncharacterized protein n=1 Tax=Penicillium hordei TaxID=40994 RepID=A0AAD6H7F7_9EURO|nr:uncharacterized protein N7537_004716 [Penicillium hordei]KAJ5608097.1 hypothetical protein N7537_004716 [Penicillium hordei]
MKATFVVSVMLASLAMASPAQPQPAPACKVDNDCKPHKQCNNVGQCIPSKATRDIPLAKVGQACQSTSDCVKGLVCDQDKNTCDAPNTHNKRGDTLSQMGQDCKTTKDCVKGFVCDKVKQTCDAPNNKRDNAPQPQQCKSTGDCAKDQVCHEGKNVCVALNNKRSEGKDQCQTDDDCSKQDTCQVIKGNKVCAAPQPNLSN